MRDSATKHICRVRKAIAGVATFLATVLRNRALLLNMGTMSSMNTLDRYYVCITLWYVYKNTPNLIWERLSGGGLAPKHSGARQEAMTEWYEHAEFPDEEQMIVAKDKEKVTLLRWLHHGSILGLSQEGLLPAIWNQHPLQRKAYELQSAALLCSASKLSSTYSASDEAFDRLAFLGAELGLETENMEARSVASLSMLRIKNRDYTRMHNAGYWEGDDNETWDGPWEVHALCHHSRLKVYTLEPYNAKDWRTVEQKAEEVESFKAKIFQFLNSEGSLVPCWERSHRRARREWVHSEASAVLASTLLDFFLEDFNSAKATKESENSRPSDSKTDKATEASDTSRISGSKTDGAVVPEGQKKIVQEMVYMEDLMTQQNESLTRMRPESGTNPAIEWTKTWKLWRRYHPENFVDSLEDTPEHYEYKRLRRVIIPVPLEKFINKVAPGNLQEQLSERLGFTEKDLCELNPQDRQAIILADLRDNHKDLLITPGRGDEKEVKFPFKEKTLLGKLYDCVSVSQNPHA